MWRSWKALNVAALLAVVLCRSLLFTREGMDPVSATSFCAPLQLAAVVAKKSSACRSRARGAAAARLHAAACAAATDAALARTPVELLRDAVAVSSGPRLSAKELAALLQKQEIETRALSKQSGWFATGKEKRQGNGSSSRGKVAPGRYVPGVLDARIAFEAQPDGDQGVVRNSASVGGALKLEFEGWFKWTASSRKLVFNFYSVSGSILGLRLGKWGLRKNRDTMDDRAYFESQEDPKKLPFFIFFIVDPSASPSFAAARGRGGGLAIWRQVHQPGHTEQSK
ncbi:hypothetical protein FVE85_8061 [Porphyridium purpureum]|uniref:Uncharacterized protein n=1 Tax=Porphyridium purpureum TaxID=35688 RepID=A0A5J4YPE0_PORPP|nr:hypothetical protein FVE85_8061 [Porphyridium purpureum]|eukprot:POR4716..scf295_9